MRESGSPKFAVAQATHVYTPDDLGMNAAAYPAFAPETTYTAVDVSMCGMWSLYIIVSAAGNHTLTLKVMEETIETNILMSFTVTAALTSGAYRHFPIGPLGAAVAMVPARLIKFGLVGAGAAGVVTARLFGRTY